MTGQEARDDERGAKVWRKHPGLGGQDGIGVRHPDGGGHQWYTVDRAEHVVAELTAGLIALGKHPEPEIAEARIEAAARAMFEDTYGEGDWPHREEIEEKVYRNRARVALEAALRVPVGEGEQGA